jgi:hypothetical protein
LLLPSALAAATMRVPGLVLADQGRLFGNQSREVCVSNGSRLTADPPNSLAENMYSELMMSVSRLSRAAIPV